MSETMGDGMVVEDIDLLCNEAIDDLFELGSSPPRRLQEFLDAQLGGVSSPLPPGRPEMLQVHIAGAFEPQLHIVMPKLHMRR